MRLGTSVRRWNGFGSGYGRSHSRTRSSSSTTAARIQPQRRYKNRAANLFIRLLFGLRYNDVTNAFKAYRATVIQGCRPFLSPHFNLTVELPLKAIARGYSYEVIPIRWQQRQRGASSLRLKEMGGRYLFIVLYIWLERLLTKGDYRRDAKEKFAPWGETSPTVTGDSRSE